MSDGLSAFQPLLDTVALVPPPLWLLPVGFAAGVVNTLAGGGSFLTLSAMIWLGMPAHVANATNRLGVFAQSAAAAGSFRRLGMLTTEELLPQVLVVGSGAIAGAGLSLLLDPELFDRVLGVCMVAMLGVTLARPSSWTSPRPPRPARWLALFAAGVYGGFLQAGVGVLLLPALVLLGGMDVVRANGRKVLLTLTLTTPALLIYAGSGLIDWIAGISLALGSAAGGAVGSRITVGSGAKVIWGTLVFVVLATALRLWLS